MALLLKRNTVFVSKYLNPYVNLTLGSCLVRSMTDQNKNHKVLFLSSSHHGVFIGNSQNCWKECNVNLMDQDGVPLVRRDTGGGACYVDSGNRLFSFIERYSAKDRNYPIIVDALKDLGVNAEMSGRNDIIDKISGKKISGSAFTIQNDIIKHHGTILVDVNKEKLTKYLNPNKLKLVSKGIKSANARIINLKEICSAITREELDRKLDEVIINSFNKHNKCESDVVDLTVDQFDRKMYQEIFDKYTSHKFLYNSNPDFTHLLENKFSFGLTEFMFKCEKNIIVEVEVFSDSLDLDFVEKLKECFKKLKHEEYGISLIDKIKTDLAKDYFENSDELCEWLKKNL